MDEIHYANKALISAALMQPFDQLWHQNNKQQMRKLFSPVLVIIALIIMPSCNKEKNEVDYHWKETWCSNPWNDNSNNTEEEVKSIVIEYLDSKNVKVKKIAIEYNESQAQFCEACSCLSGNNIIVTINDKYEKKLEELHFEKY